MSNTRPPGPRQEFTYVPNHLLDEHDPISAIILIWLCVHAGDADIPSYRQIAEGTNLSLKTVGRRIRRLADAGVIYPGEKGPNRTIRWEIAGGLKP